ncbi:MAG TPA: histidine kinase [Planctomycetota bacterium]
MTRTPTRLAPVGLVAGALGLVALVSALRMYFGYAAFGRPIPVADALGSALLEWGPWALLAPLAWRLARAVPFGRGRSARALLVHVVAGLCVSLAALALFAVGSAALREWRFGTGDLAGELRAGFLFKLHTGWLVYGAFLLGFQAWEQAGRAREEALRRAHLDRDLLAARLAAIQAQLAPHFLFNTLNAIAASVHEDPDAAERMLVRLGELLRTVLERRHAAEQSLADELAFLDAYLELQRERFGERLTVVRAVEPAALEARVPSFLLLPLVENALQHGVGSRTGPARLGLSVQRTNGSVHIAIEDDGPGFRADGAALERRGLGLESARERLRLLHGEAGRFEVARAAGGGAAIRLTLPAGGAA